MKRLLTKLTAVAVILLTNVSVSSASSTARVWRATDSYYPWDTIYVMTCTFSNQTRAETDWEQRVHYCESYVTDHSYYGPGTPDPGVTWNSTLSSWEVAPGNHMVYPRCRDNVSDRYLTSLRSSFGNTSRWSPSDLPYGSFDTYTQRTPTGQYENARTIGYYEVPAEYIVSSPSSDSRSDDKVLAASGEITSMTYDGAKSCSVGKNKRTCTATYGDLSQVPAQVSPSSSEDFTYYEKGMSLKAYVVTVTGSGGSQSLQTKFSESFVSYH